MADNGVQYNMKLAEYDYDEFNPEEKHEMAERIRSFVSTKSDVASGQTQQHTQDDPNIKMRRQQKADGRPWPNTIKRSIHQSTHPFIFIRLHIHSSQSIHPANQVCLRQSIRLPWPCTASYIYLFNNQCSRPLI